MLHAMPDAKILSFDQGRVHVVSYDETDSYQVTELFINNRTYLLDRLVEWED